MESAIVFARLMGLFAAAVGGLVLLGWHLEEPFLKQGFPNSLTTKANSAVGFILAGLGLLALTYRISRPLARLLGLLLVAGAGATLSQDVAGWNLGIDQYLFEEPPGEVYSVSPGRMSPGASLAFVLLGCILVLTARRGWVATFVTEVMLVGVLVIAITNLIGHSYEIAALYNPFPLTAMPVHMAVILALTAAGMSAACPESGFARAVTDPSAGGHMIRRLLPGIILIPILLGWIVHRGLLSAFYSSAVATALLAVATIVVMAGFAWTTAVALRRADREREEALVELHGQREWLRTTLVSIADAVISTDNDGSVEIMNPVAERLTGWQLNEAHGRPVSEVFRLVDESTGKTVEDPTLKTRQQNRVIELTDSVLIRKDDRRIPVECISSPVLSTKGKVTGAVLIFRNIAERRRAEEQQQMLVSELNHRVRNVLMIVHSLVQASAQHTESKSAEEMTKVLADRLQSLSRAHELLLDTQWSGASLKSMVERELEPFRRDDKPNVTLRGRDVLLPPQCTSVVAMALHELTTNAAKYGALATPEGRLNVSWSVKGSNLTLSWRESGTKIRDRRKPGFGMRLIDKGIRQNLGGDAKLEFADDGLLVTLQIPLAEHAKTAKPRRAKEKQSA